MEWLKDLELSMDLHKKVSFKWCNHWYFKSKKSSILASSKVILRKILKT